MCVSFCLYTQIAKSDCSDVYIHFLCLLLSVIRLLDLTIDLKYLPDVE